MNSQVVNNMIRQTIAFVIDVSPSMGQGVNGARPAILDLNDAVAAFLRDVQGIKTCDVECMFVTFADTVRVETDFESASTLTPPVFQAGGNGTDLGGGIGRALQEVRGRRAYHKSTGVESHQPWLVCITDGMPNANSCPGFDTELQDLVSRKKLHFLPVAVGGHDSYDVLERVSPAQKPIVVNPGTAGAASFGEFFKFLSQSVASGEVPNLQHLATHE